MKSRSSIASNVESTQFDVYTALLIVAAIVPLAMSAFLTWRWWSSLTHPWLFLTIAVIGLYSLIAFFAKFALHGIVIAPSEVGPEPLFGPPEMRLIVFVLGFVFLAALGLWCVKALLARLSTGKATQTQRSDLKTATHHFLSWLWVVITFGLASFVIFFSYGGPLELVLMAGVVALFSAIITVIAVFDNRRGSGVALILGAVPIGLSAIPATYIFKEFFPLPILLLVGFAVSSGVVGIRAWRHG
jgi:hypothetical protein